MFAGGLVVRVFLDERSCRSCGATIIASTRWMDAGKAWVSLA